MTGIHWAAFVPAALLASLVPGANQLLSLRTAIRQGTTDATIALSGRFSAFAVLVAVVAAGLGVVLTGSAVAFGIVKWVGVAYLAWLAVTTIARSRRDDADDADAPSGVGDPRSRWWLVRQEFLVALTNPKALLLFAAFLPQFVDAGTAGGPQLAVLGAAYIGIEAVSALGYTLAGGRLNGALTRRAERRLDGVSGGAFLGLAGFLALERSPA